jgi:hypothetical protein
MSKDSSEERDRIVDEASRTANEARARGKERAKAQAEREKANALAGATGEEAVRQLGLIYGGVVAIAIVMVQGFLEAPRLDGSGRVSVIAFSVAIPLLAALVMINRQEVFRGRVTPAASVNIVRVIAESAAFVGIVAGFW